MTKHFKTKKIIRRLSIIKYILISIFSILMIKICIYFLNSIEPIKYFYPKLLIIDYYNKIKDNTLNKPINLLNYKANIKPMLKPVINEIESKTIYVYSTHPKEKYSDNKSVVNASNYLKQTLSQYNINVTIEEGDIGQFIITNNYSYNQSYLASRYFIKEEIKDKTYDLIIDLHRDAISKSASTATIQGKKCAKILFVIGKKNKNYKKNYEIALNLNKLIKNKYPTLTRGILLQSGNNVNGIYNQDLADNIILIELGGNQNTYNEVKNTIDLISPIIGDYLNDEKISNL